MNLQIPKISVVTVCYNAAETIEKTILSIINQTYQNIEYIIIDGASTDGTVDIINKYRDKIAFFVSEPDKGIYDAMNKGIIVATGDWINFMNAGDTFWNQRAVENVMCKVEENSVIAYGDTILVYPIGERVKKPDSITRLGKEMVFGHQSTFISLDYHKHHLFDTSFRSSGDFKFFRNAYIEKVKFQYVPIIVARYLAYGGMSNTNWSLVACENARICGVDGTIEWKIKFFFLKVKMCIIDLLKRILPSIFLNQIKMYNLNQVGEKISE